MDGPKARLIQYKYFSANSCELHEPCIGGAGWRRLLMFDSTDENIGGTELTISNIYSLLDDDTQESSEVTNHGVYQYDRCHRHYHFKFLKFKIANGAFAYNQLAEKLMLNGVQGGLHFTTVLTKKMLPIDRCVS